MLRPYAKCFDATGRNRRHNPGHDTFPQIRSANQPSRSIPVIDDPVWRILLYSADSPPSMRGLVELDAVDGHVIGDYTEPNPEDWSEFGLDNAPATA